VTIPLSLLVAALVLELRGVTLNAMVLAGLVLGVGIVVHDAVAGIDHLVRRLREYRQDADTTIPIGRAGERLAWEVARRREAGVGTHATSVTHHHH
jgi:Cu/Ag efflux pump CusA